MADEILLSQSGFDKLSKELDDLKGPERMRIAEAIREAKSHGDLRENAAYHEAKLNQARLEGRIAGRVCEWRAFEWSLSSVVLGKI